MRDNDVENQPAATAGGQEDKQRAVVPTTQDEAHRSSADSVDVDTKNDARAERRVCADGEDRDAVNAGDNGKTAQELGDDAGGHGEAVRRDAARDGGEVKDAEVPTVGAASEGKVADGDDGTPARESRDDAGDSNARGDQVIEDPVTKDDASKEGADATVDADAEGKERKVAGGDAEPMPEPGDSVGGSNDYTAGSGTRADTGATRADTAVGDRDNISPDGDQARGNTCAPVRQINVPSVQTSQGKGRAKRGESKLRLYSPHDVDRSTSSSCKDDERRETCDEKDKGEESSDGEPPTYLQFLEEKLPRERHSKTKPEREAMIAAHVNVDNYVGPVPRKGYASWKSTTRVWKKKRGVNFTGYPPRFDLELMEVASAGEPPHLRLVVHSEWRMHNHASPMAASTPGMKGQPSQGAVVDTVAALHDSNASSSKIAGYMSEKFAAEDDCDVMVFHDQMDVTCGIVVQTATQKLAFKQWGETLTMDWTHGSPVATTPTGRGHYVLDVMSMNEKAVTLEKIFEFFKSKNTSWMKIRRPVEVFADETASSGKPAPEAKQRLAHLASEVSAVFATVCFRTKFYHKDSTKGIYFEEVVGYVAGYAWLNDAVVSYVSDVITASQVGVHVLSSFVVDNEKFPSPPRSKLFSMKFIVLLANIKRSHWTLIVVAVHRHGMMTVH
ncbi:hypothetical protein JG688_00014066, partial [Phytophthora aleatoria]